jgi:hypothetical protein
LISIRFIKLSIQLIEHYFYVRCLRFRVIAGVDPPLVTTGAGSYSGRLCGPDVVLENWLDQLKNVKVRRSGIC